MDLDETFCASFTTPSTCFSCSRGTEINRNLPFRFATENHVLGLSSNYRPVTIASVPKDKCSVICVGFSQYQYHGGSANGRTKEPYQALALVDPTCIEQPEREPPPLRHPPDPNGDGHGGGGGGGRDDASVLSNAHSIQDGSTTSTPMKARRPSSGASSSGATSATMSSSHSLTRNRSDSSTPGLLEGSVRSSTEAGGADHFEVEDFATALQPPKARLILQVPSTYSSSGSMSTIAQDYVSLLDFRPLSPCLAQWGNSGESSSNSSNIGIFVGSADDSRLRLYEPDVVDGRLVARTDLPEEHFQLDTPVMGIDFFSNGEIHTLAAVGQDGTIQVITWQGNGDMTFQDLSSHRVIVDGPLACLQIQERSYGSLCIVIGSLCGYVCKLTRSAAENDWQGPQMVVQGLWNDRLQAEDSVLAVHTFEDCVVIGTLGGRCLIYQAALFGERYYHLWECTLPYSVHGLQIRQNNDDGLFDLTVVTRRSLHVFQPKTRNLLCIPKPKYSIQTAKDRLQPLLQEQISELQAPENIVETENAQPRGTKVEETAYEDSVTPQRGDGAENDSDGKELLGTNIPEFPDELKTENEDRIDADNIGGGGTEGHTTPGERSSLSDHHEYPPPTGHSIGLPANDNHGITVQEATIASTEKVTGSAMNAKQNDEQWILVDSVEGT